MSSIFIATTATVAPTFIVLVLIGCATMPSSLPSPGGYPVVLLTTPDRLARKDVHQILLVEELYQRGCEVIFIACIDGLSGFKEAMHAVFPKTQMQRCIIHQVRQSLQYVSWKDRKAFVSDLRTIYQAPTREAGEERLLELGERWGDKYVVAVRSWERTWEDLATIKRTTVSAPLTPRPSVSKGIALLMTTAMVQDIYWRFNPAMRQVDIIADDTILETTILDQAASRVTFCRNEQPRAGLVSMPAPTSATTEVQR